MRGGKKKSIEKRREKVMRRDIKRKEFKKGGDKRR